MARKPQFLRALLKAQAEVYFSVKAQVTQDARTKSPSDLPKTSRGYRTPLVLSNGKLVRTQDPGTVETQLMREARRKGLEPVHGELPFDLRKPVEGKKYLAGKPGPQKARFGEQPTGDNDLISEVRVGTTPARMFMMRDPVTKAVLLNESGKPRFGRMRAKPRFRPVGDPNSVPKDGGKKV